ncbi:MAG: hypothetical protein ACR2IF_02590 [Terriglobales bacterium]
MPKRKRSRSSKRAQPQVSKFPPDAAAARDEGPRLIPLPDKRQADLSGLPRDSYITLADRALELWHKKPQRRGAPGNNKHQD